MWRSYHWNSAFEQSEDSAHLKIIQRGMATSAYGKLRCGAARPDECLLWAGAALCKVRYLRIAVVMAQCELSRLDNICKTSRLYRPVLPS